MASDLRSGRPACTQTSPGNLDCTVTKVRFVPVGNPTGSVPENAALDNLVGSYDATNVSVVVDGSTTLSQWNKDEPGQTSGIAVNSANSSTWFTHTW